MDGDFSPRLQGLLDAGLGVCAVCPQLGLHDVGVGGVDVRGDGVDALALACRHPQGFDRADVLRASGQVGRWRGGVCVVALAGVVEEALRNGVFEGAHVLPTQAVVANPL